MVTFRSDGDCMNKFATLHIIDSAYSFPVSEHEIVIRLRTAHGDIQNAYIIYESKYIYGLTQKKAEMVRTYVGETFDYFTIKLKLEDTRLAYVFYLYDGKEYKYYSEDGLTDSYDFTKGFYNFFQYPYINRVDIMPKVEWMSRAVFYQIFVDRFCIGDKDKDFSYVNLKWGDTPTPKSFAGGDLKGIEKRLDYIKGVGASAIYLTPVFKSISNHKYDISDYYLVDEHFGTNEDLKNLVNAVHSKGMRIVLDAVFNHCSENLDKFQDVKKKGKDSKYYDWFIIDGDKPVDDPCNYETFASCTYMPKFNTNNPEVQKYLIDIACFYIREYGIDGWRLDVSDEVSHDFWRAFRKAVKEIREDAVIIGENWHDASNYLRGDQYDSIMNYAFTKACLDFWSTESIDAAGMSGRLNDILVRNTDTVNSMMLNLLDSHDTHRFYSEVGENENKYAAALCLLFMFPGTPCIFYGTEIKIAGGYDPDCRKCMDWDKAYADKDSRIMKLIRTLSEMRHKYDFDNASTIIRSDANNHVVLKIDFANGDKIHLKVDNTGDDIELTVNGGIIEC